MSLSIIGSILEISEVQQIKESFKKREFVVEYADNPSYTEFIKFELIQDKCALLDAFKQGDKVNIHFNLKGRKWTDREGKVVYFNSLQAWRVEAEGGSQSNNTPKAEGESQPNNTPEAAPLEGISEPEWSNNEPSGDLPF